ncbi:MAG: endonuclease domain-containing protein [Bacteroidetes bacterium]|nr:endonuclease domain-containing protein [Bacteroidota bacterium]
MKIFNKLILKQRRKDLRNRPTQAERHLWRYIKHRQLAGFKFRRQHSIGNYIVDFYCPEIKLIIELDGQPHFEKEGIEYDKIRTTYLESIGLQVKRFENREILLDTDRILKELEILCAELAGNNFGNEDS